jgi:hypothetical protein
VEGLDLTLEAAVVKTMFLLGQKPFDPTSFKQEFQTNLAGEITSFADFHH